MPSDFTPASFSLHSEPARPDMSVNAIMLEGSMLSWECILTKPESRSVHCAQARPRQCINVLQYDILVCFARLLRGNGPHCSWLYLFGRLTAL